MKLKSFLCNIVNPNSKPIDWRSGDLSSYREKFRKGSDLSLVIDQGAIFEGESESGKKEED